MSKENRNTRFQLSYPDYYDKVLAGWMGKSMGGVIGAPFENHKQYNRRTEEEIWPDTLAANDDLDIQVVWLETMQERGLYLSSRDLVECWQDRCYHNYCEYGVFLNNVQRGIAPPLSGTWNNSFFLESEGCPIRSEIWGFVCPGNPRLAADYARMDGQLDHGGVSVEIEQFLSAMAARAFVSHDLDDVLQAGLSVIPADSPAATAVGEVRAICTRHADVHAAWRMIMRRFGDRDASKAITNHAIVLMALFLGGLDFRRTIRICVNSGWDTDCTCATAGALLGALGGTRALPSDWSSKLGTHLLCAAAVKHKNAPLSQFAEETCRLGLEMAAVRNRDIAITEAPAVVVREPPPPTPSLTAEYPDGPVLWHQRATSVRLVIENPTDRNIAGEVHVETPAGIECDPACRRVNIMPGEKQTAELTIRRHSPGDWLGDKNLFRARLYARDSTDIGNVTFGLGGARQWLVYGPYWDMWDKASYEVCPYENDEVVCTPGTVNCDSDGRNHYVRTDHPYVDEARLLREDIPEELPFRLEVGEDLITENDLGGFKGQACYYLVRVVRSPKRIDEVNLMTGRTGPCKIWMDGALLAAMEGVRGWAPEQLIPCRLTGGPQRIVVKCIRLTDAMTFSLQFMLPVDIHAKRGVSYLADFIEDRPGFPPATG